MGRSLFSQCLARTPRSKVSTGPGRNRLRVQPANYLVLNRPRKLGGANVFHRTRVIPPPKAELNI